MPASMPQRLRPILRKQIRKNPLSNDHMRPADNAGTFAMDRAIEIEFDLKLTATRTWW